MNYITQKKALSGFLILAAFLPTAFVFAEPETNPIVAEVETTEIEIVETTDVDPVAVLEDIPLVIPEVSEEITEAETVEEVIVEEELNHFGLTTDKHINALILFEYEELLLELERHEELVSRKQNIFNKILVRLSIQTILSHIRKESILIKAALSQELLNKDIAIAILEELVSIKNSLE